LTSSDTASSPGFRFSHRQSIALVAFGTVLGAAAQVLIKSGAAGLDSRSVWAIVTNLNIVAGYALYGLFTIVLSLALRDSELSVLYPIISLTFVWVTILSILIFHEPLTLPKTAGIGVICLGVALLGTHEKQ
jgi:multidrug transporter EmrE-like cation transporter